jgi:hypothetical protein
MCLLDIVIPPLNIAVELEQSSDLSAIDLLALQRDYAMVYTPKLHFVSFSRDFTRYPIPIINTLKP